MAATFRSSGAMVLALLTVGSGCAGQGEPPKPSGLDVPLSAAISAFERLIPPAKQDGTFVNCLEINGQDPSGAVMAGLMERGRDVVPASECTYVLREPGSFHNLTKRRAMFHRLSDFESFGSVSAELQGSSYVHGLFGSSVLFDLAYRDGQWRVAGVKPISVS